MQNYALWLVNAMKRSNSKDKHCPMLLDFILDLAAFTAKDEACFSRLRDDELFLNLMERVQATKQSTQERKIQFIKVIDALTSHKQGLDWIMNNSAWVDVVVLARQEDCAIAQKGCCTIAKLLESTVSSNQTFCLKVVELVTFPLTDKVANYQVQCEGLQSDIRCIVQVLESLIENFSSQVLDIFVKMKIAHICDSLSAQSKNRNLRLQLYRIVMMLSLYELTQIFDGISIVKQNFAQMIGTPKMMLWEKENSTCLGVVDICFYAVCYYTKMEDKLPKYLYNGKILDLRHEFLIYQCCFVASTAWKMVNMSEVSKSYYEDLARLEFWSHISNSCSRESLAFLYKIQDRIFEETLFDSEMLALKRIIDAKGFYQQPEIRTIFRMLWFIAEDILLYRKNAKDTLLFNVENQQEFISALLDAMSDFVENCKMSWSDCLGLSDIIELVLGLLNISQSSQLIVCGLNLINISITKNISANLVLLRDSNDPSLANLFSLLYDKCTDDLWEVRNASLNVLCSITKKSSNDFPAIKQTLPCEEFSQRILRIAFDDEHCIVRATAFRLIGCIAQFKKSDSFINNEFIDNVISTLRNSQNYILTKEVVNLLTQIYNRCGLLDARNYKMYECILKISEAHSSEEVSLSILKFWETVVNKHLSNEGIEGGKFPAAMFSKEKKKIVVLTSDEIEKRLVTTFNNLSYVGCLAQLYQTVNDEDAPDAVFDVAYKIATDLTNIIASYGVTPNTWNTDEEGNQNYEDLLPIDNSRVTLDEVDQIIDDMVLDMSFQGQSNEEKINLLDLQLPLICDQLSPKEFLNLMQDKQGLTKELRLLRRFQTLVRRILDPICL